MIGKPRAPRPERAKAIRDAVAIDHALMLGLCKNCDSALELCESCALCKDCRTTTHCAEVREMHRICGCSLCQNRTASCSGGES